MREPLPTFEDFQQDDRDLDLTLERQEKLDRMEDYMPIREETECE